MKTLIIVALALAMASSSDDFLSCRCTDQNYYYKRDVGKCVHKPMSKVEGCETPLFENGEYDLYKCAECYGVYVLKSDKTACNIIESKYRVRDCEIQKSPGICIKCKEGLSQYSNGAKCGELPSNCAQLDFSNDDRVCKVCEERHEFNGTICKFFSDNKVDNCELYRDKTTCTKCNLGYYLENDTTCTPQVSVANCDRQGKNSKGCDVCEWGYSKSDDDLKCEKGTIVDCEVHNFTDKTKCFSCKQGYQLNAEETTCTAFETKPADFDENCQTYDSNGKCTHCNYYYKSGGADRYIFPNYAYTNSVKSCSNQCADSRAGSYASILSFALAYLALLALIF